MRRRIFISIAAATVVSVHGAEREASAIIEKVNRILRPEKSFTVSAEVTTFKNREIIATMKLKAFVRMGKEGGNDSLAIVSEPAPERGKVYLRKSAGDLWFYDPKAARPVRISSQQRINGQSAFDDLQSINLTRDYVATFEGEVKITDVTGRECKVHRLKLTASRKDAPYPILLLWVEDGGSRPVKSTSCTSGGRALKTVYYDKFRGFLGVARPTEITVVDELHPGSVSRIRLSDYDTREHEAALFDEAFMPRAEELLKKG